jgi:hypothetical protein
MARAGPDPENRFHPAAAWADLFLFFYFFSLDRPIFLNYKNPGS